MPDRPLNGLCYPLQEVAVATDSSQQHHRQHVIQADRSKQRKHNSRSAPTHYEDKTVRCSGCGRRILWRAEQQRYWYEEMKASVQANINLRCDRCRKRGRHDLNREQARSSGKRRFGDDAAKRFK